MSPFHIQARLVEFVRNKTVRDETRLGEADTETEALQLARSFAADGFTVWIFEVSAGPAGHNDYLLVDKLAPLRTTAGGAAGRGTS